MNGTRWTLWSQLGDLDFPDDLALLSHSNTQMQDKITFLESTLAKIFSQTLRMQHACNSPVIVT